MTTPIVPSELPTDSLSSELAFLAQVLDDRPAEASTLTEHLAAIGGATRRVLSMPTALVGLAARVAAVAGAVVAGTALTPALAQAAEQVAPVTLADLAPVAPVTLRVKDPAAGVPLGGVRVMTVGEELLGVTDDDGRVAIPAPRLTDPVVLLEHDGYQLLVVEVEQLATRNLVAMTRLPETRAEAIRPAPPVPVDATLVTADGALEKSAPNLPRPVLAVHAVERAMADIVLPERPAFHTSPASIKLAKPVATLAHLVVHPNPLPRPQTHPRPASPVTEVRYEPTLPARPAFRAALVRKALAHPHLPNATSRARLARAAAPQVAALALGPQQIASLQPRLYVVRAGDSLCAIAHHQLGNALAWGRIFQANRSVLSNPRLIRPGQVLTLPLPPPPNRA